jgi:hypothetical protein
VIDLAASTKGGILYGSKRQMPNIEDAQNMVAYLMRRQSLDRDMFHAFDILGSRGPERGIIQCVKVKSARTSLIAGSYVQHDADIGRAGDSPLALGIAFPAQLQALILFSLKADFPEPGQGGVGLDSVWRRFNVNRAPITLTVVQDALTGHGDMGECLCSRCAVNRRAFSSGPLLISANIQQSTITNFLLAINGAVMRECHRVVDSASIRFIAGSAGRSNSIR